MISLISSSRSDKAVSSASFLGPWEELEDEADSSLVKFLIYDCIILSVHSPIILLSSYFFFAHGKRAFRNIEFAFCINNV